MIIYFYNVRIFDYIRYSYPTTACARTFGKSSGWRIILKKKYFFCIFVYMYVYMFIYYIRLSTRDKICIIFYSRRYLHLNRFRLRRRSYPGILRVFVFIVLLCVRLWFCFYADILVRAKCTKLSLVAARTSTHK